MLVTFNSKAKQKDQAHQQKRSEPLKETSPDSNPISTNNSSSHLETASFVSIANRKKKASSGCITCKIRKKRCSEERPICSDCKRLGKHCVWVTDGMDSKEVKEIRKRVREEEERQRTLRGQSRKRSDSPNYGQGGKGLNSMTNIELSPSVDIRDKGSNVQGRSNQEDFDSLDTENCNSDLDFNDKHENEKSKRQAIPHRKEITEITDFSFSPFINNHEFADSNQSQYPNYLLFQPFKSNYLNNLFQPLSPNTLTLLGSHETMSSLNTHHSNTSLNQVFQFNNLFESNVRSGLDKPIPLENELNIPNYMDLPEFQMDFFEQQVRPVITDSSPFPPDVKLDEAGLKLYDYYRNHLSSIVSIVPKESNYYKNIFLPMAAVHKGTLFAILAWSGYHLGGGYIVEGDRYMELALESLQTESQRPSPNEGAVVRKSEEDESENTLQRLASLLIMCAAEICKGDVKKWPVLLRWCSTIISKRGGLHAFHTNDKSSNWIISNFIYHDILASSLNERSTHFPIEEYNKFLKTNNFFDPLQGILKPVFHLMSEISKMSFNRVNELDQIKDLQRRIDECEPEEGDLANFNNDERRTQLKLFKTFKLTSTLYLRQSLLRINASSLETQVLLNQLLENLSIVLNSSVESSLCFPMFITGINCINENHRMVIMVHFDQLIKRYNFKNLERIKFLVSKIWDLNENGERFVDWFKIVKDLNWDVSFA